MEKVREVWYDSKNSCLPLRDRLPPCGGRWPSGQKGNSGPAGPEGENLATTRNISDDRKALSPTRCGGSPLPEGAKYI